MARDKYIVDLFEKHFDDKVGIADFTCECGQVFLNENYPDDDVDEARQAGAIISGHSSGIISFEGRQYSDLCQCWHERAKKIYGFLTTHHSKVIGLLNEVKDDKLKTAQNLGKGT